jgi:kynurenine formamidase
MLSDIVIGNKTVRVDFNAPLDISIRLRPGLDNVNAFFMPPATAEPFRAGGFIGDVNQGGSCNVNTITFNPHGNGTHTESVGHIAAEFYSLFDCFRRFLFPCRLVTIDPEIMDGDRLITRLQLEKAAGPEPPEALVIRTLPNDDGKRTFQYSGTNPCYLDATAAAWLAAAGVRHLLLDLPSVDKEDDGGRLSAHHAFWQYPQATRADCTITELVYVPDSIADGDYLLNLMVASFDNDASPSKPVLYKLL